MKDKRIAEKGQSPLGCAFCSLVNHDKGREIQACSPLEKNNIAKVGATSSLKNQSQPSLRLASCRPTQYSLCPVESLVSAFEQS